MLKSVLVNWQSDKNRGKEFLLYDRNRFMSMLQDQIKKGNYEIHNTKYNFLLKPFEDQFEDYKYRLY